MDKLLVAYDDYELGAVNKMVTPTGRVRYEVKYVPVFGGGVRKEVTMYIECKSFLWFTTWWDEKFIHEVDTYAGTTTYKCEEISV